MFDAIETELTPSQLAIARPLLEIDSQDIDTDCSNITYSEAVTVTLASKGRVHCPFQLVFGRNADADRFSFYVGLSGQWYYAWDSISADLTPEDVASDVRKFLQSTVVEARTVGLLGGSNYRYEASLMDEPNPISRLSWPWSKTTTHSFSPWIQRTDRD